MSNKKALEKFKNSLEFDFKIKVKLEKKELPEHILNEAKENSNYLEEIIQDMIENAIGEYCEKCGDNINMFLKIQQRQLIAAMEMTIIGLAQPTQKLK